jgi:thiosulfate/3-mercaptopyruvate sulfurtransferase
MNYKTIITVNDLIQHCDNPDWAIIDCRFSLADTGLGRCSYLESHIPGAVYAHLDEDLSSPVIPGVTSRHPMPEVEIVAMTFSNWGISSGVQVVAYDDAGGALAASRLWWMLRWLGHDAVAVLDGGWQAWQKEGYPVRDGSEAHSPRTFTPVVKSELLVTADDVDAMRLDSSYLVVDSRAEERYRGEVEPIDPVAGHIPGAVSAPYAKNLDSEGKFLAVEKLRERYQTLLGDIPAERSVFYCGSGVTSIHNILAMAYAGLGEGCLYAGSWSEWITDPQRPVIK